MRLWVMLGEVVVVIAEDESGCSLDLTVEAGSHCFVEATCSRIRKNDHLVVALRCRSYRIGPQTTAIASPDPFDRKKHAEEFNVVATIAQLVEPNHRTVLLQDKYWMVLRTLLPTDH